jgi:hypothetical protein
VRYKLTVQPFDSTRVLIYDSYGLDPDTINQMNEMLKTENPKTSYFATLDDDRVGIVCKPKTFLKLMGWRNKKYGKKFPVNLKQEFLKACEEVMQEGKEVVQYKEDLTKNEKEIKDKLKKDVVEIREQEKKSGLDKIKEAEDKTWEQDETK